MDVFYYYDGNKVIGPHNLRELQEIYASATINTQTPVVRNGEKDWRTLGAYCDLNAPECQPLEIDFYAAPFDVGALSALVDTNGEIQTTESVPDQHETITASEEQKESIREEDETLKQQRTTRHQLLRQIRAELDNLWEAQRESIIARIKFEPLDRTYEATRKRNREIYHLIEESALEYWQRSGLLTSWIRGMTWRDHDFTYRLRGKTEADKYANLQAWLSESRLSDLAGCYCFKQGREYIYIGQAGVLKDRIKQHEKKTYFTYANAVRIIIPKYKRQLNQLERLLILAHHPTENGTTGIVGKTPVDDCLDFVRGEIKELITDF